MESLDRSEDRRMTFPSAPSAQRQGGPLEHVVRCHVVRRQCRWGANEQCFPPSPLPPVRRQSQDDLTNRRAIQKNHPRSLPVVLRLPQWIR
jgi:hypothetical protein